MYDIICIIYRASYVLFIGHLVTDYLWGKTDTLDDYCDRLVTTTNHYNGYNLLLGDFR